MSKNSNPLNFNGTQVTLVNIDIDVNNYLDFTESRFIEAGKAIVNEIKNNTFKYDKTVYIQKGSLSCFGLLITHLGDYPSPFWFQKYKSISITGFNLMEEQDYLNQEQNRKDTFVSKNFPDNKCIINEDSDPFILHLKFVGIEVHNNSIGTFLNYELYATPKELTEGQSLPEDTSVPSQPFKLTGQVVVNEILKVEGFVKNNLVLLKLLNTDVKMDLELEDLQLKGHPNKNIQIEFPFVLNRGNQLNFSIPVEGEEEMEEKEEVIGVIIRWNVHKNGDERYSMWTNMEFKKEEKKIKKEDISITCKIIKISIDVGSITDIHDSKLTLIMNIKTKKKMNLYLRIIKDKEKTHYFRLIPFHDAVDIGIVEAEEVKTYPLYFYYLASGLSCSPKMEVVDKISEEFYKIDKKIFKIEPNY